MGQEFASSRPFLFFADHRDRALAAAVNKGRREFLAQFPSYAEPRAQDRIPDPSALGTFLASKLNLGERASHAADYDLHRALLALRREDAVLARQSRTDLDAAVLTEVALALRFFGGGAGDRLLIVNLGRDVDLIRQAEPLLAPPASGRWSLMLSTDEPRFGGPGVASLYRLDSWRAPGASAHLYRAEVSR
jgi:maltooligosyltrehalose trehalohydrolase